MDYVIKYTYKSKILNSDMDFERILNYPTLCFLKTNALFFIESADKYVVSSIFFVRQHLTFTSSSILNKKTSNIITHMTIRVI